MKFFSLFLAFGGLYFFWAGCQEMPDSGASAEAKAVPVAREDTIIPQGSGKTHNLPIGNKPMEDMSGETKMAEMHDAAVPMDLSRADKAFLKELMGQFDPEKHPDFVKISKPYTDKDGMMLRKETYDAFRKMWSAARKDGVNLNIISSTRNFDRQKAIWEGKWERFAAEQPDPTDRALKILEYSSMPGSSRHHWGTDIDLNDLENSAFEAGGKYERVYRWLSRHAAEYGFCQPYTVQDEKRPNGYHEEKWHWTYMPLSRQYTALYKLNINNEMIVGFKGAETARSIRIVENYVLGINQECQ